MIPANRWLVGVVSSTLITSASYWEGTEYYAYYDIVGVPTVCSGYTGKGIVFGKKYSSQECNAFLRKELVIHSMGVLECISAPLKENQYNAFTLMAYNVGVSGFCSSRVVKLFNDGKVMEACRAMAYSPNGLPVWSFAGGKYVEGLHKRRLYEAKMCTGGMDVSPI